MLRYTFLFLAVFGVANSARAANSWAEGLFEEMTRDFGSVPRGQKLMHSFRVVNNTKMAVHINNVRVSCGCTTARALSHSLAPGQETGIFIQMDSGRFLGVRAVTVYVTFDQPQVEEVRLIVQANSRDDVFFAPDNITFGHVKQGTTPTSQMTVTFLGYPQLQVTDVKCDSNYIQPKVAELRRENGEVIYQVTTNVRADIPEGKWYTDVWLSTNNAALAKLRVPLTVEIEAPAPPQAPAAPAPGPTPAPSPPATPSSVRAATNIALGQVKAAAETDRQIILRGSQPFRIIGVSGADKELIVHAASNDARTVHVLTVTIRSSQPGALLRNIHVLTDMQNNKDIEFNAQAQILP